MMMMMTTDAGRNKLHCSLPKSTRCGCRGAFFMLLTPHVCFDSPCATQLTMFVNAEPDALEARYDGLNLMGVLTCRSPLRSWQLQRHPRYNAMHP